MLTRKGMRMVRATNLFAAASATLLILGLVLSNFLATREGMSVSWPGSSTGYIIGYHVPCYGLAGLFAIFACLYALYWIRLNQAIVDWHLWLSLLGVAMFGIAFALFDHVAAESPVPAPSQGILAIILGGLVVGPLIFVVAQLLFIVAFIRSIATPHH
jgi:hypothetical protein